MKNFPKKFKPQELKTRSKLYIDSIWTLKNEKSGFFPSFLPVSKKLTYQDFYLFYLKDFFRSREAIKTSSKDKVINKSEHLFIFSNEVIKNFCDTYTFFDKRNQSLSQIWMNKAERRIASITKKNINSNNKILNSYFSSPYKFFMSDSAFYIYLINKFHALLENWKIYEKTNIWYLSFNLQTSIPEKHIIRKEERVPKYTLRYFICAKWDALYVNTDKIDICCWDVALLVHPKDKRYSKFIWKNAIIPLCNRQIPIIWDESVNIAVDNWIKRVCPCADIESIAIAKKYWLPTDIYVFDQQWLYTSYIHDPAFIWWKRDKYYKNIEWFVRDIWSMVDQREETKKVPYLKHTNERLVPYKVNELIVDIKTENEKILNDILSKKIHFSFIEQNFKTIFDEISLLQQQIENYIPNPIDEEDEKTIETKNHVEELKQKIVLEIKKYLPEYLVCNSQIQSGRRIPLIKDWEWDFIFFDIENQYLKWNEKPLQKLFDFVLLSLIRIGAIWTDGFWEKNDKKSELKLCKYDKFFTLLFQNEKRIKNFLKNVPGESWGKNESSKFMKIIQNLMDENNPSIDECNKLIKGSRFIKLDGDRLIFDNSQEIYRDFFSDDFLQRSSLCYINNIPRQISDKRIYSHESRAEVFQELALEYLLLGKSIYQEFMEFSYDEENEFFWDKQLSKLQLEQTQRNLFQLFWENPVRLTYLTKNTYDQKEIILNNIFLKQIWNAVRLCKQKWFLPKNIKTTLNKKHENIEDFDLSIICKLNDLYRSREDVKTFTDYISFFEEFKSSIQNLFFARYLEIQKNWKTANVHLVCSYFFTFLMNVLYPLVPEFVKALCYVSENDFLTPVQIISVDKSSDYNMNTLYDIFIKIKNIKIDFNIKQHEFCNLFIKSNPTIWEMFEKYEQIFKKYFHIQEVSYLRLHEKDPLWYDIHFDENLSIWIQAANGAGERSKNSIDDLENDIRNLKDKLWLIRHRIQILPEGEDRNKAEEEYISTKQEMEELSIKYSIICHK